MTQEILDFGRAERVTAAHRRLLRVVGDAVDAISLLVAAGACDARKSELADALAGREGRHFRTEWLLAIMDAAPDHRARIAAAMLEWLGMTAAAARARTAEERLADLERRVAAELGTAGARLVEENRR